MTAASTTAAGSRRRRLWDLPPLAQELLLALALPPAVLRQTVAQVIGRRHGAVCQVSGSEADVLFSALHDAGRRNVLSEALHKLLDARYAAALRQLASVRDDAGLAQAWAGALAGAAPPALLWPVLTHPHGAALQDAVLRDLRCWLHGRARDQVAGRQALDAVRAERDRLAGELDAARMALQRAHAEAAAQRDAAAQQLAALRGQLARVPAATATATAATTNAGAASAMRVAPTQPPITALLPRAGSSAATASLAAAPASEPARAGGALAAPPSGSTEAPAASPPIQGRSVLCVGGINGAVHRYRSLIEAGGARFTHHDGGIEDSVQRLPAQLAAADLVVCQAGCLNHDAYRCVKAHCKRLNKPCLFLQRPSLSALARGLGLQAASAV